MTGLVINDPVVVKVAEDKFWLSIADNDIGLWSKAAADLLDFDCHVSDANVGTLALQGPKAVVIMESLFGEWIRDLGFFKLTDTQAKDAPPINDPTLREMPILIARAGWSPEDASSFSS